MTLNHGKIFALNNDFSLSYMPEGIVSASFGYDHLFPVSLFTNTTRFRIGFFVEGAVITNSNGFASFGIGVGF